MTKQARQLDHAIIRFAGGSGDGMQPGGGRFTQEMAIFGNDLSTLPKFPAEIQAPAGTPRRRPSPCSPWRAVVNIRSWRDGQGSAGVGLASGDA